MIFECETQSAQDMGRLAVKWVECVCTDPVHLDSYAEPHLNRLTSQWFCLVRCQIGGNRLRSTLAPTVFTMVDCGWYIRQPRHSGAAIAPLAAISG
jgi:hypothetical protein